MINVSFPQRERAQAIAIWAAIFGLGFGIGPVLGGALLKFFYVAHSVSDQPSDCVIALIGGQRFLGESQTKPPPSWIFPA